MTSAPLAAPQARNVNTLQKAILSISALAVAVMALLPPWSVKVIPDGRVRADWYLVYAPAAYPPGTLRPVEGVPFVPEGGPSYALLAIQIIAVGLLTAVAYSVAGVAVRRR